jgi:hypothetical protein
MMMGSRRYLETPALVPNPPMEYYALLGVIVVVFGCAFWLGIVLWLGRALGLGG